MGEEKHMRIIDDPKLDYSDVLIRPKRSVLSSRSDVDLWKRYKFANYSPEFPQNSKDDTHYFGVPIIAANMDGVGTVPMALKLAQAGLFTTLHKYHSYEDLKDIPTFMWENNIAISTGVSEEDMKRVDELIQKIPEIKFICIDVANGYSERFIGFVEDMRTKYLNKVIIAGNVVTPDITEELILRGADIVKVGIGPGSVCTTRVKTGVGYPQLSAVIECADASHGLGGHIIADGGCSSSGDVAKAFGAGADFVMLGGMLAGTDQGGGEIIHKVYQSNELCDDWEEFGTKKVNKEKSFVQFYGMSSTAAQEKHGGTKNYRASEGRVIELPYRGDVSPIIGDILGGVRSTCTYVGAKNLKELPKRTTFIRVNTTHNRIYESVTTGE